MITFVVRIELDKCLQMNKHTFEYQAIQYSNDKVKTENEKSD